MKREQLLKELEGDEHEWLRLSLRRGGKVRGFLFRYPCWKPSCKKPGWALFLQVDNNQLIVEAAKMFRYPGIHRQLRGYFKTHLHIAQEYGSIEERFSGMQMLTYLSQGCRACNAIYGTAPLRQAVTLLWEELTSALGSVPDEMDDEELKHIFTLDWERLFDA